MLRRRGAALFVSVRCIERKTLKNYVGSEEPLKAFKDFSVKESFDKLKEVGDANQQKYLVLEDNDSKLEKKNGVWTGLWDLWQKKNCGKAYGLFGRSKDDDDDGGYGGSFFKIHVSCCISEHVPRIAGTLNLFFPETEIHALAGSC